jgi:hypothetical protein
LEVEWDTEMDVTRGIPLAIYGFIDPIIIERKQNVYRASG